VLPGKSLEGVRLAIIETIMEVAQSDPFLSSNPPRIIWNGFQAEGAVLAPGSAAESALGEAHRAVFGANMGSHLSAAVNDTRYFNLYYQIPALCYGPAGDGMHGVDERANLGSLKQTTLVIALFIAIWTDAHAEITN
jgi:acetylornithine deacetylase